ncbi:hypothetical protein [Nostoc sp.]|uniref:hypothetical protein n=1 Tax=Nostoc sp. TaxID=1180 RepID=UPI002FF5FC80
MNYPDELRQWAIFERLSTSENVCRCRFRKRSDADAYVSLLRRGGGKFEVIFDPQFLSQGVTQG